MKQDFESLISQMIIDELLIYGVLSSPLLKSSPTTKVEIRPISLQSQLRYQLTEYRGKQTFHQNLNKDQLINYLKNDLVDHFKAALLCSAEADYHLLVNRKKEITILKKPSTHKPKIEMHNRQKKYLLQEGTRIPFLIELGIMSKEGKVYPKKYDKFRQLNRFLENIADLTKKLDKDSPLHVVDFGCGKSYLTFALYHFLTEEKFKVSIVGLDLKKDVIEACQKLSDKLNFDGLQFQVGDINNYVPTSPVDMVISLHACDTATDAALEKAIQWEAKVILCVPCCQHELLSQIQQPKLSPLLKHGILKERFAALATDAARAHILEIAGYHTQIIEFIDMEHTPKNLLIRAIKRKTPIPSDKLIEEYLTFKKMLQITPSLEVVIHGQLRTMDDDGRNGQ